MPIFPSRNHAPPQALFHLQWGDIIARGTHHQFYTVLSTNEAESIDVNEYKTKNYYIFVTI
eukprot:14112097-Ditylum_brightwellii.AAC.1